MSSFRRACKTLKNESGAALMMAIFCVTMLMVIATEIMYETNVELAVSTQSVNNVKAHYAAVAAVEISLLRIQIYRKAAAMVGDSPLKSMLDPIWQMPFAWPPVVPESTTRVNKDEINDAVKESAMQGKYAVTITPESAKIDINDLASPLKGIQDNTKKRIKDIFAAKLVNDEAFDRKFRGFDFDQLINNIKDYVDEDKASEDGAQESLKYPNMGKADFYPPNQPFKTLQEIHMVAGMTDEIYDLLIPNITIYGSKGINVNYASADIFKALDPRQFTEERVQKIIEGRGDPNRGPFKDEKDFLGFLQSLGINDEWYKDAQGKPQILLLFDAEYNFRVEATGIMGKSYKNITAIVYDFDRVKSRMQELVEQMKPTPPPDTNKPPPQGGAPTPKKSNPAQVPNERPNIVYWNET